MAGGGDSPSALPVLEAGGIISHEGRGREGKRRREERLPSWPLSRVAGGQQPEKCFFLSFQYSSVISKNVPDII